MSLTRKLLIIGLMLWVPSSIIVTFLVNSMVGILIALLGFGFMFAALIIWIASSGKRKGS